MTGPVADAPGDMSVVLSECWDIDRRTLDSKRIYRVGSGDAVADVYEGDAALPGSVLTVLMVDMLEHTVVSTISPGGPCDVSGPVADVAGDVLVVSSECRDIYRGTLEQTVISTIGLRGPCDVTGPVADAPGDVLVV